MKPKVFIGSSTEGLKIAYAIQENLEHDALCKVWTQGIFQLSGNALDNLVDAVKECDFAILLFQTDDITKIRDRQMKTVRDNVIFEFGLFVGGLGKERVFYLVPKESGEIHLPTDLIGVTPGQYVPPEGDEDLLAAIGPFCNRVRRQIASIWSYDNRETETFEEPSDHSDGEDLEPVEEQPEQNMEVEPGIMVDQFGNYIISIAPTVLWADRIAQSFPGVRELYWFNNGKEALDRLKILLKDPLRFEDHKGYGTTSDPIWWWRGGSCLPINRFRSVNGTRCLMDVYELNINRIAVYRAGAYYQSFVYVETNPDDPTGLYSIDAETIQNRIKMFGYASEEYALYQDNMITRECYDDGAAVIDGAPVDTSGAAELRVRYLSNYNFMIAPKFSPINSNEFDKLSKKLLDEMLSGHDCLAKLCEIVDRLPRHKHDD